MMDNGSPPVWDIADPVTWLPLIAMFAVVAGIWVYTHWRFSK